ncbi:hypothetical protein BC830DRAFT_1151089 [Chytriomyces sp. MP71]|nr:hypothetical protein BC830DRAFT_1151089 [Chytriomyces sp. MP71]
MFSGVGAMLLLLLALGRGAECQASVADGDGYRESLAAKQDATGRVHLRFSFVAGSSTPLDRNALADVANAFGVEALSLAFTQGTRCVRGQTHEECRPPGVVLWAWIT